MGGTTDRTTPARGGPRASMSARTPGAAGPRAGTTTDHRAAVTRVVTVSGTSTTGTTGQGPSEGAGPPARTRTTDPGVRSGLAVARVSSTPRRDADVGAAMFGTITARTGAGVAIATPEGAQPAPAAPKPQSCRARTSRSQRRATPWPWRRTCKERLLSGPDGGARLLRADHAISNASSRPKPRATWGSGAALRHVRDSVEAGLHRALLRTWRLRAG